MAYGADTNIILIERVHHQRLCHASDWAVAIVRTEATVREHFDVKVVYYIKKKERKEK